ncbi:MAG: hypothetical protein ACRCU3_09345 [Eubacteriaceae bacterium]
MAGISLGSFYFKMKSVDWDLEAKSMEALVKETTNQQLNDGLKWVSIEKELTFDTGTSQGEARISNPPESQCLVSVSIISDKDGKVLYESRIIEPGYYIEMINLVEDLEKGDYVCTALWNFYSMDEEFIGEAATKMSVTIKN